MGWSSHRELILHWFRARGQLSAGAVEGLDGKVRVITKRAYGFRTYRAVEVEVALYQPWPPTRAGLHPQILLRSQIVIPRDFDPTGPEESAVSAPAGVSRTSWQGRCGRG